MLQHGLATSVCKTLKHEVSPTSARLEYRPPSKSKAHQPSSKVIAKCARTHPAAPVAPTPSTGSERLVLAKTVPVLLFCLSPFFFSRWSSNVVAVRRGTALEPLPPITRDSGVGGARDFLKGLSLRFFV